MHKDPYENLYMTITGVKHFTLLPPIACCAVREKDFKAATYSEDMKVVVDEPEETVRNWPSIDPDEPYEGPDEPPVLFQHVRPIWVDLHPGEMLYLPALWSVIILAPRIAQTHQLVRYHKVGQSNNEEGFCCAVNLWYETHSPRARPKR